MQRLVSLALWCRYIDKYLLTLCTNKTWCDDVS